MLRSLAGYWRVFGTGLGFLPVGIGGVMVFPLLNVFVWGRERRTVMARDLIGLTFRCIVRSMRAMGVFQYEINGLERLERQGLLILANHPTLIDIVFFGNQPTPPVITTLGSDVSNRKTNAFGKSDEKACNWAFLSAMVALEKRAQQLGANAVINIVSFYKKDVMSSATEFECHAGALIAGVALKGDFVKIAE